MSYLPTSIKLDDKKVLIIGGGEVAYRKLNYLLDFTKEIFIIAPDISESMMKKIESNDLEFEKRVYRVGDIKGFDIVIIAINDIPLQTEIFRESRDYRCLCNSVDSTLYCDFILPAYIKKDDLLITVSTSGSSPALAKHLKYYLKNLIPDSISDFLKEMKKLRETLPKGEDRMRLLNKKAKKYIESFPKK